MDCITDRLRSPIALMDTWVRPPSSWAWVAVLVCLLSPLRKPSSC